ncbi:hypothetical protein BH20ACI3_BH20ACI3_04970 [soil metagenome]
MDYSLNTYRLMIKHALASGYRFEPFSIEYSAGARRIYLRHDIDYSLEMALILARVNAELGVAGTFCALLQSQLYNLLSPWSQKILREIHGLGQYIGLHIAIPVATQNLEANLRIDFQFIQHHLPVLSPVFAWHNPTADVLERYLQSDQLAGLLNAYAARFTRDISYFSDSNMRHSVDDFLRLLNAIEHPELQLLLHPLNWVAGGSNMGDVFSRSWPYIIREKEQEMLSNRYYSAVFPSGMPEVVLRSFVDQWLQSAEKKQDDGRSIFVGGSFGIP